MGGGQGKEDLDVRGKEVEGRFKVNMDGMREGKVEGKTKKKYKR